MKKVNDVFVDDDGVVRLTEDGAEVPDQTPVEVPVRIYPAHNLLDTVRALVSNEISRQAGREGYETFEESDDFAVGDDYNPTSPYELSLDQEIAGYGGDFDGEDLRGPERSSGPQGAGASGEPPDIRGAGGDSQNKAPGDGAGGTPVRSPPPPAGPT